MVTTISVADRAPVNCLALCGKSKRIELRVNLRPCVVPIGGCPLSEIYIVPEPRRVLKLNAVLNNEQLICYKL